MATRALFWGWLSEHRLGFGVERCSLADEVERVTASEGRDAELHSAQAGCGAWWCLGFCYKLFKVESQMFFANPNYLKREKKKFN